MTRRGGWTARSVEVRRRNGRFDSVPGFVSASVPGLAVTPTIGAQRDCGGWTVTHIQSGDKLGPAFLLETRDEAQAIAERVRGVCDWTASREAINAIDGLESRLLAAASPTFSAVPFSNTGSAE